MYPVSRWQCGGDGLNLGTVKKYLTTEGNLRRTVPVRCTPGTTGDHTGLTGGLSTRF